MKCYIDLETRSEADLTSVGAWNYSRHPSTSILVACVIAGDVRNTFTINSDSDNYILRSYINQCIDAGLEFVAHNASFEKMVLMNVLGIHIDHSKWHCTMAKASHCAYPRSLEELGAALHLPVRKDVDGKRLVKLLCMPRKPSKKNPDVWCNDPVELEKLAKYCALDTELCKLIDEKLPDLSERERKVYVLDQQINFRGVGIDVPLVSECLKYREEVRIPTELRLQQLTDGEIDTPSQAGKLANWINKRLPMGVQPIEGVAEDHLKQLMSRKSQIPPEVLEVIDIRMNGSMSSTAKYVRLDEQADRDTNRVYNSLKYHGASTGRWAGSGPQLHNLPRGDKRYKDQSFNAFLINNRHLVSNVIEAPSMLLKSAIRGCIVPSSGKILRAADYNAIEARVLAWVTDEETMLTSYRDNRCLYSLMASRVYGVPIEEIKKDSKERFVGKELILACGYGMGPPTFVTRMGLFGEKIELELAEDLVKNKYRGTFPNIPAFWKSVELAAVKACREHNTWSPFGKVAFIHDGSTLYCRLPSGRMLFYPFAKLSITTTKWGEKECITYLTLETKAGTSKKFIKTATYGGKLTENICQAIARDIMVDGMLRVTDAGYDIILTVHDELLSETDISFGSDEEYSKLLEIPPEWGADIPLKVEGWSGFRYHK
jgi:DNA polymerase